MSNAVLSYLFGYLLIIAIATMAIVFLRQFRGALTEAFTSLHRRREHKLHKITKNFEREQEEIGEGVDPMFELWWGEIGKKSIEDSPGLLGNVELPVDPSLLPREFTEMIKHQALHIAEDDIREFAVHLAAKQAHQKFIEQVRHIDKVTADRFNEEYEKHVESHRKRLDMLGLKVDDFEQRFTTAS